MPPWQFFDCRGVGLPKQRGKNTVVKTALKWDGNQEENVVPSPWAGERKGTRWVLLTLLTNGGCVSHSSPSVKWLSGPQNALLYSTTPSGTGIPRAASSPGLCSPCLLAMGSALPSRPGRCSQPLSPSQRPGWAAPPFSRQHLRAFLGNPRQHGEEKMGNDTFIATWSHKYVRNVSPQR